MSAPRRQTPAFPRVWAPGHSSGLLVVFWTMIFWGSAQAVLWCGNVPDPLELLRLDPAAVRNGEYWRLLSYQFLHAGVGHFAFNLLVLWFVGREIEPIVTRHHFLWLCLTANALGGVANLTLPAGTSAVGFSAAVAAVLAAYATIMPELEESVSVFFLFPLRFRAKYLAFGMVVFGAICTAFGFLSEIGPAGILAGTLVGWMWARMLGFGNPLWFQRRAFEREQREFRLKRMSVEDFIATEMDPILEKISREGMGSLTRAERRVLTLGREKLETSTAPKH